MKQYLYAALLMLVSGGIGYWIGRKSVEKKCQEELRREIDGMKQHYRKSLLEKDNEIRKELGLTNEPISKEENDKLRKELVKATDDPPGTQQRKMVTRMQKPVEEEDIYEEDECDPAEFQHPEDEDIWDTPFVISEEEYSEEKIWYDKLDYEFYLEDQSLVNEIEEVLLNWEDEIGIDAMALLLDSYTGDIVYVRNDELQTDFSIEVKPGKAGDKEFVPRNEENHPELVVGGVRDDG